MKHNWGDTTCQQVCEALWDIIHTHTEHPEHYCLCSAIWDAVVLHTLWKLPGVWVDPAFLIPLAFSCHDKKPSNNGSLAEHYIIKVLICPSVTPAWQVSGRNVWHSIASLCQWGSVHAWHLAHLRYQNALANQQVWLHIEQDLPGSQDNLRQNWTGVCSPDLVVQNMTSRS